MLTRCAEEHIQLRTCSTRVRSGRCLTPPNRVSEVNALTNRGEGSIPRLVLTGEGSHGVA
eukprot:575960-Heterocapsa_arctica.AAC.1